MQQIKIGILGLGQVGTGLYSILKQKKSFLKEKTGSTFVVKGIAVKDKKKKRKIKVPEELLTTNAYDLVRDPSIDVIVELVGGTKEARKLVAEALRQGKHVVTANKALLAEQGDEIFDLAIRNRAWLAFEASVGGGIPIMKALREGLVANHFDSIHSIINGTSNYILSQMAENDLDFKEALSQAQEKGYAEADPTFDIEGIDAAHKLAILVRFAFGGKVKFKDIHCEGISSIRKEDISFAKELGYRVKLLALAKYSKSGIEARVQPTLLPESNILANVNGAFNAVLLHGDEVGDSLLYGQGAGPHPTASAVLSDLMDVAKRGTTRFYDKAFFKRGLQKTIKIKRMSTILSRYYIRFSVIDQPGVLASISRILGQHEISISDCVQKENSVGKVVPLIVLTHGSTEKNLNLAMAKIDKLSAVKGKSQVIRMESH